MLALRKVERKKYCFLSRRLSRLWNVLKDKSDQVQTIRSPVWGVSATVPQTRYLRVTEENWLWRLETGSAVRRKRATRRERLTKGGYERVGIGSAVEFIGLPQATRAEA